MKIKLISDQFALYDKAFDQACKELKIADLPTQKQRWLYRYLQISPPYIHAHLGTEDDYSKAEEGSLSQLTADAISGYAQKTYKKLGDVWGVPFHIWWFQTARRLFTKPEPAEIHEFFHKYRDSKTHEDGTLDLYLEKMREDLTKLYIEKDTHYFILGVPWANTIEENMRLMKRFFKENAHFFQIENTLGYTLVKNKITTKALANYYRALEVAIKNKDTSLVDIAKKAKTLNTSNVGADTASESTNSVRAGTSRQIQMAVDIAEQASGGMFPVIDDFLFDGKFNLFERRPYESYRKELELAFELIHKHQFDHKSYLTTIRRDLKAIKNQII